MQTKLIVFITTLVLAVLVTVELSFDRVLGEALREEMGERALSVAEGIALHPDVVGAFGGEDPTARLGPVLTELEARTGADFVTVANRDGVRYWHENPERIGRQMANDNEATWRGESVVTEATGSLGPSLRAKVPVYNEAGDIVGLVSVGFLSTGIEKKLDDYQRTLLLIGLATLVLAIGGVLLISRAVKKALFGLEPKEIGQLYREKTAILESVQEGLLAVNKEREVTLVNQKALRLLRVNADAALIGRPVGGALPASAILSLLTEETDEPLLDVEMTHEGVPLLVNRVPVRDESGAAIGAVMSVRDTSEVYRLEQRLQKTGHYAEALRSQTHEHQNKLHLLAGLIQLESYDEALEVIVEQADHQSDLTSIVKRIPSRFLAGLLLGKMHRAAELGVTLRIEPVSLPSLDPVEEDALVTVVGNLIDNAFDAVQGQPVKQVTVRLTTDRDDAVITVEDTGSGISPAHKEELFQPGFSTKAGADRGYGLAIVQRALRKLDGSMAVDSGDDGTVMTVVLRGKGGCKDDGDDYGAGD